MRTWQIIPLRRTRTILVALALLLTTAMPAFAAAPSNDDIANASPISALPFADAQNTADATSDASDPAPDCATTSATVWYALTLAADTRVAANTFGSDYDTTLSVYSGAPGALTQIACNDDAGSFQSSVIFDAAANTTYYIMVGSFSDSPGGNLTLSVDVPPPVLDYSLQVTSAKVKPTTGIVTLSGTVTCSRPVFVDLFAQISQRSGRATITGASFGGVDCNGKTNWSITLAGDNGLFAGGKANFFVDSQAFDAATGSYISRSLSGTVTLKGSR